MYSAIVFLPLLGAIIAGIIAIFGAAQRHPGGEPEVGATLRMAMAMHMGHVAHRTCARRITSRTAITTISRPRRARARPS